MTIINNSAPKSCKFEKLQRGDVFRRKGCIYMKIPSTPGPNGIKFNAVDMEKIVLTIVDYTEYVEPLKSELVIS
jgi:hypothetical protein